MKQELLVIIHQSGDFLSEDISRNKIENELKKIFTNRNGGVGIRVLNSKTSFLCEIIDIVAEVCQKENSYGHTDMKVLVITSDVVYGNPFSGNSPFARELALNFKNRYQNLGLLWGVFESDSIFKEEPPIDFVFDRTPGLDPNILLAEDIKIVFSRIFN